jgi:hypothetical protein
MEGASSLFAGRLVSIGIRYGDCAKLSQRVATHDLARIFLLLRLRRRTRFFLHLSLIFVLRAG